ncbi:MAG: polysaccharide biosynthesis protein [Lachnospiraceae bacterium]|nr:polysaccharide biosynthesis protein [Lachnospiraceae bacterium]
MIIERTKNTFRGSLWGFIQKVSSILLPFVTRTIIIKKLGIDYVGLNSLFSSVLQVLSLSELGFSTAIVYCMYKPIAEDDIDTVNGLICYLKKIYKIVGLVITALGLMVLPFLQNLISGDIPGQLNIYILYVIYLANTSISYFLLGYKTAVLNALQRNDIQNIIVFITTALLYILQIVSLLIYPNYYVYVFLIPLTTLVNNIITSVVVDKMYPQFTGKGTISKELRLDIRKRLFPLLGTKIGGIMVSSADTIVISTFLGLELVGIYNNYYYIENSVAAILLIFLNSTQAGIGNLLVKDSNDKIVNVYNRMNIIDAGLVCVCTSCLLSLYQPFMMIWVGSDLLVENGIMFLFCIYFYIFIIQRVNILFKDAAGIWREDLLREYSVNILNIVLNIVLITKCGLYGVIGSSVLAWGISLPWSIYNVCKYIIHENPFSIIKKQGRFFAVTIIAAFTSYYVCSLLPQEGVLLLFLRGIICCIISILVFVICNLNNKDFKEAVLWLKSYLISAIS